MPKLPDNSPWIESKMQGFTLLPNEVLEMCLQMGTDGSVLQYLLRWVNWQNPDEPVKRGRGPSSRQIGRALDLHQSNVVRSLYRLEEMSYISVVREEGRHNSIVVNFDVIAGDAHAKVMRQRITSDAPAHHLDPQSDAPAHHTDAPAHHRSRQGIVEGISKREGTKQRRLAWTATTFLLGKAGFIPSFDSYPSDIKVAAFDDATSELYYQRQYKVAAECCGIRLRRPGEGAFVPGFGPVCFDHYPATLAELHLRLSQHKSNEPWIKKAAPEDIWQEHEGWPAPVDPDGADVYGDDS